MAAAAGNARVRPFQDDLDRIISERVPLWLRLTAPGLAALLLALLLLAAATRIDTVVSGRGRLASDRPVAVLQPMQRALIRAIAVRPGDSVRSGQVLATLDPTFAQADLTALQAQARALAGEVARLQAEATAAPLSPATAPDRHVATVPDRIDRSPSATISCLRSGTMAPMPPTRMPRLPKFAKPQRAKVTIRREWGERAA